MGKTKQSAAYSNDLAYVHERDQLIRHIGTFRKVGALYRRHDEVHQLQLYRRNDIADVLRKIGFRVRTVRRYGDYPLLPGRVAFVARKAADLRSRLFAVERDRRDLVVSRNRYFATASF